MPKIINISPTPNENAMRFELSENLTSGVPYSYENIEESKTDSLAFNLFSVNGVVNAYYLMNFFE